MKVSILKGLPASGKSTYARELVAKGNWVRVNKDDLRASLHNSKHSKIKEKLIEKVRDSIIVDSLIVGQNIVVDDTNLSPRHERRIREVVHNTWLQGYETIQNKPEVEVKFFDVDIDECIKRDLQRSRSVGEKVIRRMYNQFIRKVEVPIPALNGYNVVLCDMDGTLALFGNKNPYERDFINDELNLTVATTIKSLGLPLILMSGRSSKFREETEQWLEDNNVRYEHLFMREEKDNRKDSVVKRELYEKYINGKYNVFLVLDDRNQVVNLWRDLGLTCFQVAPGDF